MDALIILALILVIGMFCVDHRLKQLVNINQEILNQQRENAKALQWIVDRETRTRPAIDERS